MIRQAFMEGYMVPGETSLLKIYLKFLQSMSFRDHLHLRRLQLVRIFKDVEMLKLWNHLRAGEIKQYIWYRSFLEIDFPVFLFLGQFVFLALTCAYLLVAHARRRHIETPSFPPFKGESYGWAKVSLFTFLFLCVAEYSHHEPDCLFHLPLGIVFLALMFLAGTYLSWSPRVARAYQFFMGIAALRAAIAFVLVLRGAVSYSEP